MISTEMLYARFGLMVHELEGGKDFRQTSGMVSTTSIVVESVQATHNKRDQGGMGCW